MQSLFDYRISHVMACDIGQAAGREDDSRDVTFREVGEEECAWIAELDPDHEQVFRKRWRSRYRCFAAEIAGRCAGFSWAAIGPAVVDSGGVASAWSVPAGAMWKFDTYSHPLAVGVAPELIWYSRRRLREDGIGASLSAVEYDNEAAARLQVRMGARCVGRVTTVFALGIRLHLDRAQNGWRLRFGSQPFALAPLLAGGMRDIRVRLAAGHQLRKNPRKRPGAAA